MYVPQVSSEPGLVCVGGWEMEERRGEVEDFSLNHGSARLLARQHARAPAPALHPSFLPLFVRSLSRSPRDHLL